MLTSLLIFAAASAHADADPTPLEAPQHVRGDSLEMGCDDADTEKKSMEEPLEGRASTWAGVLLAVTGPVVASQSLASYEAGCFCGPQVGLGVFSGSVMMVSGAIMTVRGPRKMTRDLHARDIYVNDAAGKVATGAMWVSIASIVPYALSDANDSEGLATAGLVLQVGGAAVALGATATQYSRNMKAYNRARDQAARPGTRSRVSLQVTPTPTGLVLGGTF